MASAALPPFESVAIRRKPPASEQYNWISDRYESAPEQLELELPVLDDAWN